MMGNPFLPCFLGKGSGYSRLIIGQCKVQDQGGAKIRAKAIIMLFCIILRAFLSRDMLSNVVYSFVLQSIEIA